MHGSTHSYPFLSEKDVRSASSPRDLTMNLSLSEKLAYVTTEM